MIDTASAVSVALVGAYRQMWWFDSKEAEVACGNIDEPKRTLTVWGAIAKYWQHKCMRVVPVFNAICGFLYLSGDIYTRVW